MATFHGFAAFSKGGLVGVQANQRDWSPFLGHFTSWRAMAPLHSVFDESCTPALVAQLLEQADADSFEVLERIAKSQCLKPSRPRKGTAPARLCFSECTLPGVLGHCERYGRFGLVFRKHTLFSLGARPCTYVSADEYAELVQAGADKPLAHAAGRRLALANRYVPPRQGRVQDYTHEREWRVFEELDLAACPPELIVAPAIYTRRVRTLFPATEHVLPLDLLHEWGL
ncbi:MAG: hypothetical protein IT454_15255 [Planctomycetes bacterium]|nr:hypothetical protein [Planctomycetota bacterium]